jgi:hypothetical protein
MTNATNTRIGGYVVWVCQGCPSHGRHPKAGTAQDHADLTGHNVIVTHSQIHLIQPKPKAQNSHAIPMEVRPDDLAYPAEIGPPPRPEAARIDAASGNVLPAPGGTAEAMGHMIRARQRTGGGTGRL